MGMNFVNLRPGMGRLLSCSSPIEMEVEWHHPRSLSDNEGGRAEINNSAWELTTEIQKGMRDC